MHCRIAGVLGISISLLSAQGEAPKKAADYPVHVQVRGYELGAEYLVHSVPTEQGTLFTDDYLVIELAVFPSRGVTPVISTGSFTLRINGKKSVLLSQAPGMVAASLKYPDWQTRRTVEGTAGNENGDVIVGRPPAVGRFPGDPTGSRLPRTQPPEETGPAANVGRQRPISVDELVTRAALPEGPVEKPVRGCIFFPFHGKTKSIKSLELLYASPDGGEVKLVMF